MSRPRRRSHGSAGMTLLEILLALSIFAVIVVVLVGSLRVGVRAWEAGERQTSRQQEIRGVVELITEALSAAYPYRARLGGGLQRVVLFQGEPEEVRWITSAPPLTLDAPAAPFHAVVLRRGGEAELRVVERLLPAEEPFADGPHTVLSRSVTALRLQYRDDQGLWQDRWDGQTAAGLPTAVRIEVTIRERRRPSSVVGFVVPIPLGKRAA